MNLHGLDSALAPQFDPFSIPFLSSPFSPGLQQDTLRLGYDKFREGLRCVVHPQICIRQSTHSQSAISNVVTLHSLHQHCSILYLIKNNFVHSRVLIHELLSSLTSFLHRMRSKCKRIIAMLTCLRKSDRVSAPIQCSEPPIPSSSPLKTTVLRVLRSFS
ncbi:hypothetical protein VNO77_08235 [Canavalia gladiata]|uniref:Uncharacterized protein n=1 Tax=Canavalia gladiata TaxID=3824 RepID=A0AAN9M8B7_CANGL